MTVSSGTTGERASRGETLFPLLVMFVSCPVMVLRRGECYFLLFLYGFPPDRGCVTLLLLAAWIVTPSFLQGHDTFLIS